MQTFTRIRTVVSICFLILLSRSVRAGDLAEVLELGASGLSARGPISLEMVRTVEKYQSEEELSRSKKQHEERQANLWANPNLSAKTKEVNARVHEASFRASLVPYCKRQFLEKIVYDPIGHRIRNEKEPLHIDEFESDTLVRSSEDLSEIVVYTDGRRGHYYPKNRQLLFDRVDPEKQKAPAVTSLGFLSPEMVAGYERISTETKWVDGSDLLFVFLERSDQPLSKVLVIDPSIGYRLRRMEIHRGDHMVKEQRFGDYKFFGDHLLPTTYEEILYRTDTDEIPFSKRTAIEIKKAAFDVPITDELFTIDRDAEARVFDLNLEMYLNDAVDLPSQAGAFDMKKLSEVSLEMRLEMESQTRNSNRSPDKDSSRSGDLNTRPRNTEQSASQPSLLVIALIVAIVALSAWTAFRRLAVRDTRGKSGRKA